MDVSASLKEALSIVDEALPLEDWGRGKSVADRTELRRAALPLVLAALLAGPASAPAGPDTRALADVEGDDDDLISSTVAGGMLHVSGGAVIEYCVRGLLDGFQTPGGRWRFRRGDVRRFQFRRPLYEGLPGRGSVPIGDIVRMRDAEGLSIRQIAARTGLSSGAIGNRYRTWKEAQAAGRASPAEQRDQADGG